MEEMLETTVETTVLSVNENVLLNEKLKRKGKRRKLRKKITSYVFLTLFSVVFLFPIYCLLIRSITPAEDALKPILWPETISGSEIVNAYGAFFDPYSLWYLRNTLFICVMKVLGTCLISSMTAYALAKIDFGGRNVVFTIIISTVLLPSMVTAIPLFIIYDSIGWTDSLYPLWLPIWFGGGAMNIFLVRQFIRGIPNSLSEAAVLDGAGHFRIYCTIILPLIKPILIYLAVTTFNGAWNDFEGPMNYVANSQNSWTLSLALYMRVQGNTSEATPLDVNQQMAIGVIMMLPGIITFAIFQKQLMEGVVMTGLKG
ncbi:MAG: carbohydrate ABC transporter permease [Clostridia bacterium]|nr:carbohydrate ABC transporter permease [Clostridia bacterium]